MKDNWTSYTRKHLETYASHGQMRILERIGVDVEDVIRHVVARVRAEIGSGEECWVDEDRPRAIPEEVIPATSYLILEALKTKFSQLKLTPDQVRNAENSRRYLRRIARGEVKVSQPTLETHIEYRKRRRQEISHEILRGLV